MAPNFALESAVVKTKQICLVRMEASLLLQYIITEKNKLTNYDETMKITHNTQRVSEVEAMWAQSKTSIRHQTTKESCKSLNLRSDPQSCNKRGNHSYKP